MIDDPLSGLKPEGCVNMFFFFFFFRSLFMPAALS